MNRHLAHLATAVLLTPPAAVVVATTCLPHQAAAQLPIVIETAYSLPWTDTLYLKNIYNATTDTVTMKSRFPAFVAWCKANYLTGFGKASVAGGFWGSFRELSEFVAAHNDAVWRGHAAGYTAHCQSRTNVIDPGGKFKVNFPLMVAFGKYSGQGTSRFYYGGTTPQGSTELTCDRSHWIGTVGGDYADANVMQSRAWGDNSNSGYDESMYIGSYRLVGDMVDWNSASYHSSGIAIWDMGETGMIENVYSELFNDHGIELVRGTPSTLINCSTFFNGIYGICVVGGALNNTRIIGPSGDGNGRALVGATGGYARVSGGLITIIGAKVESYSMTNPFGEKGKPHILFDGGGYLTLDIQGASIGNHDIWTDALIRIDSIVNTVTVDVTGMRGYDYKNVLQVNGTRYTVPNIQYGGVNFHYSSAGPVFTTDNGTVTTSTSTCTAQLNYLDRNAMTGQPIGTFDYVACTPTYTPTGSSPTCVYTYTAYGPCIAGTHSRTVINAAPPGCTGSPVLSESCTAPTAVWDCNFDSGTEASMPAQVHTLGPATLAQSNSSFQASGLSGGKIFVLGNKPGARYPLAVNGVRKVFMSSFKATALNGGYVMDKVKLNTNGTWTVTGANLVAPLPPTIVANGSAQAITLYFDAAVNIGTLFNPLSVGTPNAQQCEMSRLQLFTSY